MLSLDIYLNETTRHADVILPGISPLEDTHYDVAFPQLSCRNHARYSEAVFERPAGQPAEWETLLQLAHIAGGGALPTDATGLDEAHFLREAARLFGDQATTVATATKELRGPDRLLEAALRSGPYGDGFGRNPEGLTLAKVKAHAQLGGIDLGPLQARLPEMLRTVDGRIQLAPQLLLDDLVRARAELARPAPAFVVIGRREVRSNNSWMHNLPVLAKGPARCTVLVHPQDAMRLGLHEGGQARIATARASAARSVVAQVACDAGMMPGVISLPHGWGHDEADTRLGVATRNPGVNLNILMDEDRRDLPSGNAVLTGVEVVVTAVAANPG
jgi:anaerobic selenocysteine-containing dehydrogenase